MMIDNARGGEASIRYCADGRYYIVKTFPINDDFKLEQNNVFVTIAHTNGVFQIPIRCLVELAICYADTRSES